MKKPLALPKGVTILCPACGLHIAICIRDMYKGDVIHASFFKPLVDNVEEGSAFKCIRCDADYLVFKKFLTLELGWLPKQ